MHVDVGRSRKLVVDDVVDGRDIESSSGDVGGEEDSVGGGFESASERSERRSQPEFEQRKAWRIG